MLPLLFCSLLFFIEEKPFCGRVHFCLWSGSFLTLPCSLCVSPTPFWLCFFFFFFLVPCVFCSVGRTLPVVKSAKFKSLVTVTITANTIFKCHNSKQPCNSLPDVSSRVDSPVPRDQHVQSCSLRYLLPAAVLADMSEYEYNRIYTNHHQTHSCMSRLLIMVFCNGNYGTDTLLLSVLKALFPCLVCITILNDLSH